MIDLGLLSPTAALLAVPARYPKGLNRVRRQFRSLGVERIITLLNTPDRAEFERLGETGFADRDTALIHYSDPPPKGFRGPPGTWYQTLAWRDAIGMAATTAAECLLILEDDAILTPDAAATLAAVDLPPVWDCLYLGAQHGGSSNEWVAPHLLRLHGSLTTHAILVHRRAWATIRQWPLDRPMDNLLADHLHPNGHCYALWQQACVQAPGVSTITGEMGGDPALWVGSGAIGNFD